ncbi:hypothetical protein TanjilG_05352 [Lupinus angustifolius]|uniref:WRKY domain-containing protein n=1 Tax=Lupinus angustifolius TaxID=3871 RepID=A0A1J7IPP8_LUPAN|nr:hypothetical protein TanjilG_05352 [Lupinus angustifolius]
MDSNASPKLESEAFSELKSDTHASKKRKMVEKRVVRVRVGENVSKVKNEGLPSDFWCSTCKGCSAKKQVERCRTDSSMLIITYTSNHNHSAQQPKESKTETKENLMINSTEEDQEHIEEQMNHDISIINDQATDEDNFHYLQSPIGYLEDVIIDQEDPFKLNIEKSHDRIDPLIEEEPLCSAQFKNLSALKSEELDFFYELEELPMFSSFLPFTRSNFLDEMIHIAP